MEGKADFSAGGRSVPLKLRQTEKNHGPDKRIPARGRFRRRIWPG